MAAERLGLLEALSEGLLTNLHDRGFLKSLLCSTGFSASQLTDRAMARAAAGASTRAAGRQEPTTTDPRRLSAAYRLATTSFGGARDDAVHEGGIIAAMRAAFDEGAPGSRDTCTLGHNLLALGGALVIVVTRIDAELRRPVTAQPVSPAVAAEEVCAHPECSSTQGLKLCGRCGQVSYCSRAHQIDAWAAHKPFCSKGRAEPALTTKSQLLASTGQSSSASVAPPLTLEEYELASSQLTLLLSQCDEILEPDRALTTQNSEALSKAAMLTPYESALSSDRAMLQRAALALVEAVGAISEEEYSVASCLPKAGFFRGAGSRNQGTTRLEEGGGAGRQLQEAPREEHRAQRSLRVGLPVIIRGLATGSEVNASPADEVLSIDEAHSPQRTRSHELSVQRELAKGSKLNNRVGQIVRFEGTDSCLVQLLGMGLESVVVELKRRNLTPCDADYYATYMATRELSVATSAATELSESLQELHLESSAVDRPLLL